MDQAGDRSPFRPGSRDGRPNVAAAPARVSYKPPALRLICLLGFTALFVGCIASIEWLISETSTARSPASSVTTTASLHRRKLTTITQSTPTCGPTTLHICTMNRHEYYWRSAVAEQSWYDLCSAFSTTFAPYRTASLPGSLQAPFTRWTNALSQQSSVASQVQSDYYPCTYDAAKECSRKYWNIVNPNSHELKTFTFGCTRTTVALNPPCTAHATVSLSSGTIVTTSYSLCGVVAWSQMIITTDIPDPTTPTSDPAMSADLEDLASIDIEDLGEANKAVADIAPLTTPVTNSVAPGSRASPSLSIVSATATSSSSYMPNFVRPTAAGSSSSTSFSSRNSSTMSTITSRASLQVTPSQSVHAVSSTTIPGSQSLKFVLGKNEVVVQRPFTWITYFVSMFLPAIIAVIIKSLWSIIATSLKLVEPFQRLTEGDGASAKYSILSQYFESLVSFDIVRALSHGRIIPISSALIYIMVEIAPLISTISMTVQPRKSCRASDGYHPCDPAWIINMPLVRLLEAFLLIATLLLILLMYFSRKSRIPVATNPGSIASLAALLNHGPLIRELQKIDPDASSKHFNSALKNKLFRLTEHYDLKTEQTRLGFVLFRNHYRQVENERDTWLSFSADRKDAATTYERIDELPDLRQRHRRERSWSVLDLSSHRWFMVLFQLLTTSALLTILLTYWFDLNFDDAFNRFANAQSVAPIIPRTVFVGLAIIVDLQIKHLERIVRITDPFRRLGMRNARPETTILLPLNGTCWSNLGRNLYLLFRYELSQGRMLWATIVSLVACLSDVNIIAVSGFLHNIAQTQESYNVCGYLSMICTSAVFAVVVATVTWWLNVATIRRMPRQPENIGHILSYLCGSEMVRDWNTVSMSAKSIAYLDTRTRDDLIRRDGRRFCFGRMLGTDDKERWCIDYERVQSQVMVANDVESRSIISVPPIPEHWQVHHQQVKRKPLPVRIEQQQSGWEPTRTHQNVGRENSVRQARFPSLRLTRQQVWGGSGSRGSGGDSDMLLRH